MASVLLLYSTTDGQTRKICERMKAVLERQSHRVTLASVDEPLADDVTPFDRVFIGASIRYGKHARRVHEFVERNRARLDARPNAFFSVNLVARKPEKNTPETNPYVRKFVRLSPWRPRSLAVFAGRLDYRILGFWDRQIIRFIMWLTDGPTDAHGPAVEFTDWAQVDAFAERIGR